MKLFKKDKKAEKEPENKDINLDEKINLEENTETIFEKNRKNLKDLIATDYDFSKDERYALIGDNTYMKNMYIGLLPQSVSFASFLHSLYVHGNVDTSIFIKPIDSEVAKAELSKQRTNLEMEYYDSGESNNRRDDMAANVAEAQRLRTEVRDGLNKLLEVSIISTLYENDLRDLNNSTDLLKKKLGQQDIGIKSATFVQEDAFMSNKPFNKNILGEWHNFDKRSLACVFPFTNSSVNHENGILIGFNLDNGLPLFHDQFDRSLKNYNEIVFAASGGGKSTYIKSKSARSSTLDKVQNISIDIEPEYEVICSQLGGLNIIIAPNSNTILNPFDIVIDLVKNKITKREEEKILLNEKINSVTGIIMTMAKGTTDNNVYYNDITKGIIKEIIKQEYKEIGITEDPKSLYEYDDSGIIGGTRKKKMPTLSSWYTRLEDVAKKNTNETYRPYYDYLLMVMADFTKIKDGGFDCFDGESTVNLSYDIPFINFNISELNEGEEQGIAQHIICDYIWEQMVKRNNTGHKMRIIIDEAWRMVKLPSAVEFLDKGFRRARKKNTSFVVISQQFDEFYREDTKAIITNADTKIFLPPDETSVDRIKDVFKLTEGETQFLKTCNRGEGLAKIGKTSAKLTIEIPDIEYEFIETNQNAKIRS